MSRYREIHQQAKERLFHARAALEQALRMDTLGLLRPKGADNQCFLATKQNKDEIDHFILTFPYLFYEVFPQIPLEKYDTLSLSISLYMQYMIMMDRLTDGKVDIEPNVAYWLSITHQQVIKLLASLFPTDSFFWDYFDDCRRENVKALSFERFMHSYRVQPYSEEEQVTLALGKSAMAKAGIAALCVLVGAEVREDLVNSCKSFHVGFQLIDDVQDWRSDYRDHAYSPLLTRVLLEHGLDKQAEQTDRLDVNVVGTLIYTQNYAQETLRQARDYFRLALHYVQDVDCPAWESTILVMLQRCYEFAAAIDRHLRLMEQRPKKTPAIEVPEEKPQGIFQIATLYPEAIEPESYLRRHGKLLANFWQATGTSANEAEQIRQRDLVHILPVREAVAIAERTLARCQQLFPLVPSPPLYLLAAGRSIANAFVHQGMWCLGVGMDPQSFNVPVASATLAQIFMELQVAKAYGRLIRLANFEPPATLLDKVALEGIALAFVHDLYPDIRLDELIKAPSGTWAWFQHNRHYLWQEIQNYLGSTDSEVANFYLTKRPDGNGSSMASYAGSLLGYDMVIHYRQRIGHISWPQLVKIPAYSILDKGAAMAVAARVSGQTTVRLDM